MPVRLVKSQRTGHHETGLPREIVSPTYFMKDFSVVGYNLG